MTSEQVTSPPWSSRRLVHSKEMVWASRWSVALRTFSIGKFFLCYIGFFFWNFRPRLARELFAYYLIGTNIYIIWYFIFFSFNTTSGLLAVARGHNAVSLVRPIRLKVIATPRILIFAAPVICIQRSFCFSGHVCSLTLKFCTMLQAYVDIRWCALPQYWGLFRSHVSRCFSGVFDIAEVLPATLNASEKHHVAVFSPILDPNSIQYVHHMILYECSNEAWGTLMDPGKTWRSKQTGKTLTRGNLMMGHGSGGYWFFESCRIHVAC